MPAKDSQIKILIRTVSNYNEPGTLAYIFHRLTGIILAVYLFLHIWVISNSTASPAAFDLKLGTFSAPIFLAFDAALLAAASFHAFNGFRIIFFDLGIGIKKQKLSFVLAMILTSVLAFMAAELLIPVFFGRG